MLKEAVLDEDALVEAKDACLEELGWTYESFLKCPTTSPPCIFRFAHIPKK